MDEHELEVALVALREPTRGGAPAPVEPVRRAGRARRQRVQVLRVAAVVLVVAVVGGALVRLAARPGGRAVETQGPGLSFGAEGPATPEQLERTAALVDQRLDQLGQTDAEVTVENGGVVVRGADDAGRVATAAAPSVVTFRPVLAQSIANPTTTGSTPDPAGVDWVPDTREPVDYQLGPSDVDGSALASAAANRNPQTGRWTVNPVFRPGAEGIDRFNALAAQCYAASPVCPTRQMAIVVAGKVVSAPTINAPSFAPDRIEISGDLTEPSAKALAGLLDIGDLPVTLRPR